MPPVGQLRGLVPQRSPEPVVQPGLPGQAADTAVRREPLETDGVTLLERARCRRTLPDYGRTDSAPFYEPFYRALEAHGHRRNTDIRVAGYDSRLTPDMGGFLERTRELIEKTCRDNGNRPVHLVAHSNGPLYAPVPPHPYVARLAGHLHPGVHSDRGQLPRTGPAVPGPVHRAQHPGLRLSDDQGERREQRASVPERAVELHECVRPQDLREP
ncbi:hypothetical protein E4K10_23250 [Streptomyces sp. T1317-0309]|nr:hypothetical protein E4K10_23250 [Streptomyces sp. T1317-0309]